jgi:hypothetical protein
MDNVQFHIGEVVASPESKTYNYGDSNNYEIVVRTYTDFYNRQQVRAIPLNSNIKQIPLIGEHVLLVQGLSAENTADTIYPQWYYVASFSLNSNVNANLLKGVAPTTNPFVPKTSFIESTVAPLQPYEGDILVEGRFSNSIRLGSSIKGGDYSIQPNYSGANGNPIIILSNGKNYKKNSFIVEDIVADASSVYLTSTQTIPTLMLGDKNSPNSLSCFLPNESQFAKSQFIGTADRVILKAKTDIVVIDSPRAIILNTTGDIKLGNDEASSNMVHGDILLKVLQKILNQLSLPIQCGTMVGTFVDQSNRIAAQQELQNLLSQKYYLSK